ncbi:MAG: hypothetical protein ACMUEM_07535 [Flavobacteriales bacterium AspAUS03]
MDLALCFRFFENDATCFDLGKALTGEASTYDKIISIILGMIFLVNFIENKKILKSSK